MSKRLLKRHFGDEESGLVVLGELYSFFGIEEFRVYLTIYNAYDEVAVKTYLGEDQVKQLIGTLKEILKKWERYKKGDA